MLSHCIKLPFIYFTDVVLCLLVNMLRSCHGILFSLYLNPGVNIYEVFRVCVHLWCVDQRADGIFIWLVHAGYMHCGFDSKCTIVIITESVWGLLRVIQRSNGDF